MTKLKRILVPIDSSEIAERAMKEAIKIKPLKRCRNSHFICSRH